MVGERTGDGDALHLAAGHLLGAVVPAFAEADAVQERHAAGARLVGVDAGEDHGQGDVLERGHHGVEVELLEHVADLAAAQEGQLVGVELRHVHAVDEDAPVRGGVQAADHVEEGGLAGARRSHHADVFAAVDVEVDPVERADLLLAAHEDAAHVVHGDEDLSVFGVFRFVEFHHSTLIASIGAMREADHEGCTDARIASRTPASRDTTPLAARSAQGQ